MLKSRLGNSFSDLLLFTLIKPVQIGLISDCILHTSTAIRRYLNHICLYISCQITYSSLTSTSHFCSQICCSLGICFFSDHSVCIWEALGSTVSELLKPSCLVATSMPHSKPLKSTFFPTGMRDLNFSKSLSPRVAPM